jgi:hypothetical protein
MFKVSACINRVVIAEGIMLCLYSLYCYIDSLNRDSLKLPERCVTNCHLTLHACNILKNIKTKDYTHLLIYRKKNVLKKCESLHLKEVSMRWGQDMAKIFSKMVLNNKETIIIFYSWWWYILGKVHISTCLLSEVCDMILEFVEYIENVFFRLLLVRHYIQQLCIVKQM